jgi:hypothetical protein
MGGRSYLSATEACEFYHRSVNPGAWCSQILLQADGRPGVIGHDQNRSQAYHFRVEQQGLYD